MRCVPLSATKTYEYKGKSVGRHEIQKHNRLFCDTAQEFITLLEKSKKKFDGVNLTENERHFYTLEFLQSHALPEFVIEVYLKEKNVVQEAA